MRNVYDFAFSDSVAADRAPTPDRFLPADEGESFHSGNTRNVTGLSTKSRTFVDEILDHPLYMAMCEQLLKPHCANYVLNHSHLINVGPGAKGQPLHRDEAVWDRMPGLGVGSHLQFASVVALVDFTAENGATRVAPGSHLWDGDPRGLTGRVPVADEVCSAEMPAGSVVLYLGWTFHGAGRNRTDVQRRGLHVSYCQGLAAHRGEQRAGDAARPRSRVEPQEAGTAGLRGPRRARHARAAQSDRSDERRTPLIVVQISRYSPSAM